MTPSLNAKSTKELQTTINTGPQQHLTRIANCPSHFQRKCKDSVAVINAWRHKCTYECSCRFRIEWTPTKSKLHSQSKPVALIIQAYQSILSYYCYHRVNRSQIAVNTNLQRARSRMPQSFFMAALQLRPWPAKSTGKLGFYFFTICYSPTILVFWCQISSPHSKGFPTSGCLKQGWGGKIQPFSSFKHQYLENGRR